MERGAECAMVIEGKSTSGSQGPAAARRPDTIADPLEPRFAEARAVDVKIIFNFKKVGFMCFLSISTTHRRGVFRVDWAFRTVYIHSNTE